jgi:hypothetical protein
MEELKWLGFSRRKRERGALYDTVASLSERN